MISLENRIFNILASHAHCRFQPKKEAEIHDLIHQAVKRKKPMEMFMLWGVWKKNSVNGPEREALDIIESMQQKLRAIYPPGFRLTIVMADTHAAINLLDTMSIYGFDSYLGSFQRYAQARGHQVIRLSDALDGQSAQRSSIDAEFARIQKSDYWPILVASAGKYYEGEDKQEGARAYVRKRLEEKPGIEKAFANHIFLTYNGPRYDVLAPDVPTLYPVPNHRRTNEKPWFVVD